MRAEEMPHSSALPARVSIGQTPGIRRVDWVGLILGFVLLLQLAAIHVRGDSGLSIFQDDFFYYAKIAANIVAGHGSTFNGVVATNGYHPLWMLVMIVLTKLAGNIYHVIWAVELVVCLSVFATFLAARYLLTGFLKNRIACSLLALFISLSATTFLRVGMEVTLTIPLGIYLLARILRNPPPWTPSEIGVNTGIAALLVLSRLDSVILVAMLAVFLLANRDFRRSLTVRHSILAVAGFLPFFIYLAMNHVYFGTWLPISGTAKQLRFSHALSTPAFHSLLSLDLKGRLPILIVLLAIFWFPFVMGRLDRFTRAVFAAVLLFPVVHFCVIAVLSDWPVWTWYFYSSLLALSVAIALFAGQITSPFRFSRAFQWALMSAIGVYCAANLAHIAIFSIAQRGQVGTASRVLAADHIERFAETHPGRYAMGDRAGVVAEVLPDPIIQTEGLVMDMTFMKHLRAQEPLLPVLREYGVRYYIASVHPGTPYAPCLKANEPAQAGPTSAHMTALICSPPEAVYRTDDYVTLIYDLNTLK